MNNRYFINHIEYTEDKLIVQSEDQLKRGGLTCWEKDLFSFILQWFSPKDYILINTSGSTGSPKEIRIPKTSMLRSAQRSLDYFTVKPFENALLCLPVKYIAGMMMVVRSFVGSLNLILLPPQHMQLCNVNDKIGFAAMVPLQIENLMNKCQNIDSLRKLILGGTSVSLMLEKRLKSSFRGKIWETYGMTETITHVAVRKIGETVHIFNAIPGIYFSEDKRKCLVITDPFLNSQPIYTNDCVELLSKTSFRLLGRFDHVINSGGIKIRPENLEHALTSFIKGKYCITSMSDDFLGEIAVLVVEKGENMSRVIEGMGMIDHYHRPKKVFEIERMPLNANGKTDYNNIKEVISMMLPAVSL